MKHLITTIFIAFIAISQSGLLAQQTINGTLTHDGLARTYILYIPSSYTGAEEVPLVINFHGLTSDALSQMYYGDFRPIADRENFLVVHPQGTIQASSGVTYWNAQFDDGADDIGFTSALIDELSSTYKINLERVYSTGMSNGGFMSYTLACELSDRIAAIASVTGSMTTVQVDLTCDPANVTPVMEIHGTADQVVPYDGDGAFIEATNNVINHWIQKNNCHPTPEITMLDDVDIMDMSTVERYLISDCDENTTIELFKVLNGGHTWPGAAFEIGLTNQDINASEEIWRFFSQYDLNGVISSEKEISEDDQIRIYPSPVRDELRIEFSSVKTRQITLMNLEGRILLHEMVDDKMESFDVAWLSRGAYFLQIHDGGQAYSQRIIKI